jgi:hypothetical protein
MFVKTKIALAAATRPVSQSATYTMIPAYSKDGGVVTVPDPDHFGQPQATGDQTPENH